MDTQIIKIISRLQVNEHFNVPRDLGICGLTSVKINNVTVEVNTVKLPLKSFDKNVFNFSVMDTRSYTP